MLILYERKENMIGANAEAVPGVEDILSPKKAPTCLAGRSPYPLDRCGLLAYSGSLGLQ
jgi:hypothetical protein